MLSRAIQLMNKVYIISPYELFICFDSGLPYWYNGVHVSALDNVSRTCMMHDPDTILILDLIVKFIRFLTCLRVWSVTFFCFNIGIIIFGNRVYHHEALCLVHSWSQYNVDFWPQSQIYRVLTCQTISIWVVLVGGCVAFIYDIGITSTYGSISLYYTRNLHLGKIVFTLCIDIGIPNLTPWDNMLCIFMTCELHGYT